MILKKGAMFGKLSQLDRINLKKAAMFGLDARIALAIFGALSVISGAALYSAIKTAQAESWRQYFVEHAKASEQYYLDNGKQVPLYLTGTNLSFYAGDLVGNRESLSTWKGPYIDGVAYDVNKRFIKDSFTKKIHANSFLAMILRQSSTWTEMNDWNDELCVLNNADCAEWFNIQADSASATATISQLFKDLDELVDGGDGKLAGKVRYNEDGNDHLMYMGRNRVKDL